MGAQFFSTFAVTADDGRRTPEDGGRTEAEAEDGGRTAEALALGDLLLGTFRPEAGRRRRNLTCS